MSNIFTNKTVDEKIAEQIDKRGTTKKKITRLQDIGEVLNLIDPLIDYYLNSDINDLKLNAREKKLLDTILDKTFRLSNVLTSDF